MHVHTYNYTTLNTLNINILFILLAFMTMNWHNSYQDVIHKNICRLSEGEQMVNASIPIDMAIMNPNTVLQAYLNASSHLSITGYAVNYVHLVYLGNHNNAKLCLHNCSKSGF